MAFELNYDTIFAKSNVGADLKVGWRHKSPSVGCTVIRESGHQDLEKFVNGLLVVVEPPSGHFHGVLVFGSISNGVGDEPLRVEAGVQPIVLAQFQSLVGDEGRHVGPGLEQTAPVKIIVRDPPGFAHFHAQALDQQLKFRLIHVRLTNEQSFCPLTTNLFSCLGRSSSSMERSRMMIVNC